ncbi:hypothetical protein DMB66_52795 [Actinoplanes sp. ATCC 53533]|uniref:hypothetical protein n=1 Tax=Actinoplanes sp. ATCC 53533 TaxID=1288362 RepID=UPI000F7B908A|nr:hypothetical protein [Actinoplanes sp. ATCC 53533]RSM43921.1 hypothetical protein DMB66_52795 [Actinoplanes sp. ATCC 53533]
MWGRARREARLDPVRWRRPGRSTLLRSAVVAALVMTAALVLWTGPEVCASPCPSGSGPADAPSRAGEGRGGLPPGSSASLPPDGSASLPPDGSAGLLPDGSAGLPPDGSAGLPPDGSAGLPSDVDQSDPADVPRAAEQAPWRPAVPPGSVGVPIRLAEPTALRLVRPGDHVDVFRVPSTDGSPQAIATAALVLGVTGADDPSAGGLLLALTPAEARRTVTTPGGGYAVLIRPDG